MPRGHTEEMIDRHRTTKLTLVGLFDFCDSDPGWPLVACEQLKHRGHFPSRLPFAVFFFIDPCILCVTKLISPNWRASTAILGGQMWLRSASAVILPACFGELSTQPPCEGRTRPTCFPRCYTFSQEGLLITILYSPNAKI